MKLTALRLILVAAVSLGTVAAQQGPANPLEGASMHQSWEFGAIAQGGNGITDNRNSFHFLMAGAHAGRVLTGNMLPGILRGNFEYAVEAFPY